MTRRETGQRRSEDHPLFGDLPFVEVSYALPDGRGGTFWERDLEYRPPVPPEAVPGDIEKQEFCSWCHPPHYYYVDEPKWCVECRKRFVFSAEEQKFWFEELKFNFHSIAIRCQECRRSQRRGKATKIQLQEASRVVEEHPDDASSLVTYAEAIHAHYSEFREGKLDTGLAAARRALTLAPELHEARFWEAALQELAGRPAKARQAYELFLQESEPVGRCRTLREQALGQLGHDAVVEPAS
ncbi:MAG: zinc-ribbon domain containing protein [Actinobacteria bacterium]|nr:zinc-ribbon domain containing protein [Actinomycetota bacterium]